MSAAEEEKYNRLYKDDAFCILPWVHVHKCPANRVSGCCVSHADVEADSLRLEDMINAKHIKALRKDMLNGVKNPACRYCYETEETSAAVTPRKSFNDKYAAHYAHAMKNTDKRNGTLKNFKMTHFDIRFSNVCNFKCRSCSSSYSSQWELEDTKHRGLIATSKMTRSDSQQLLEDVYEQIPNLEHVYFAGGEPLVTEEHYLLLEEFLRQGRDDLQIIYNTNISKLKYKNKDLVKLWGKFKKSMQVFASLDHYGPRAEYIRHGTVWEEVEENYRRLRNPENNIQLNITTTITALNYVTLGDFIQYFYKNDLWPEIWQLQPAVTPEWISPYILPDHLKYKGRENIMEAVKLLRADGKVDTDTINLIRQTANGIFNRHGLWKQYREEFKYNILECDRLRNESLAETLPELAELIQ